MLPRSRSHPYLEPGQVDVGDEGDSEDGKRDDPVDAKTDGALPEGVAEVFPNDVSGLRGGEDEERLSSHFQGGGSTDKLQTVGLESRTDIVAHYPRCPTMYVSA